MPLDVFGQRGLTWKCFTTIVALELFLSSVVGHVLHEIKLVNKSFATNTTDMWSLHCMFLHLVCLQISILIKLQITLVTLKSDPFVHDILVASQVSNLRDHLSTEGT